jgi:peptidoglycan/xylan/chitin deacetylase (PgdA/CDA1 family)
MRYPRPVPARRITLALAAALTACTAPPAPDAPQPPPVLASPSAPALASALAPALHTRIDGHAFPDKVIALTWDDGPDVNTLELAAYLKRHRISATFFVVGSWIDGLSDDPGEGKGVFLSGYELLPILGDLVGLGHRVANHTLHHVILREAAGSRTVDRELRENQQNLDPFLTNELRLFRAPGGGWGPFAAGIVDGDPYLGRMIGPIAWDVDRKDWDESLHCRGPRGNFECERAGPGGSLRMKPSVVAARYVAAIESAGHGIVLLHDRVGHVGSAYGLDVAQAMVPQLEARGFVFAAPVLRFSAPVVRHHEADLSDARRWDPSTVRVGDVNGDRRADVCGRDTVGITCAISVQNTSPAPSRADDRLPRTIFRGVHGASPARPGAGVLSAAPAGAIHLADVTGDGQDDVCIAAADGIACAASNVVGELGPFRSWSPGDPAASRDLAFADVDGDGKADACRRTATGIACAKNLGGRFDAARSWLADPTDARGRGDARYASTIQLADVDGDGRADVCGRSPSGLYCSISSGKGFGKVERWSDASDFGDGAMRFGDLNGDGRADVCGTAGASMEDSGAGGAIVCALSTAHGFTHATIWLAADALRTQGWLRPELAATLQLGDVNGDGRADLCGRAEGGVACALAP